MKRKFKALLTFLKPYQEEVSFYWRSYDGNTEWNWTMCDKKEVPEFVQNIASEITESFEDEIEDILFDNCYSETEYYQLYLIVNPVKKTAVIKLKTEHYTSQAETYENKLNNPELEDYFERTGVEIIEARYGGGGDSGDIDTIKIDGEDSNIQWSSNDESERLILKTLYDNLENAYAGWEIDDGSAGTIELNNNQEIVISHEWNIREMDLCDEQIEITMDMLED
jgi:hypothetical protein